MARGLGRNIVVPSVGGGGGLTNINVSGGTTSNNLSNLVFDNGGGVTFGLDGSTITASAPAGGGGLTNIRVSAGTTSNLLSAITFADANGISFGINASTLTGSHNALTSQSNQNVTAANGGFAFQTLSFSNANNFSFGTSAGSAITGSYTVPTVPAQLSVGDSTGGNTVGDTGVVTGRLVLAGGNNITLSGSTNAGSMTITVSGPNTAAQSNQQMTLFATSNTTQSSTGTTNASSIIFAGAGIASVGITNGSIVVSVPAGGGAGDGGVFAGVSTDGNTAGSTGTVSTGNFVLVGSNGISLSQSTGAAGSAATVTINGVYPRLGLFNNLMGAGDSANDPRKSFAMQGDGTMFVNPLVLHPYAGPFPGLLTAKTMYVRMSLSGSTATMSQAFTVSFFYGIYTTNVSTLSLLNSVSVSFGSNAANANLSTIAVGNRYLTIDSTAWSSEPVFYPGSVYYIATFLRTSGVSWQTMQYSGAGFPWASNSASHSGTIGVATANATTMGLVPWVGQLSASTNALPATIASNALNKQAFFAAVPMIILNENNVQSF